MNQLISNLLMQPRPTGAVERREHPQTLIEKLGQERGYYLQEYQSCLDSHDVVNAIDSCIDIVKQHNEWVSVDERKPKDKSRVLAFDGRREFIALYDKGFYIVANGEYYGCVTHWMELPSPPHDPKGGAYERDLYQVEKEKGKFFKPSEVMQSESN